MLTLQLEQERLPAGCVGLDLAVKGCLGGHSGINIHEDRANAVRLAAATAEAVLAAVPGARLVSLSGGDKRNAIPRECSVLLAVSVRAWWQE